MFLLHIKKLKLNRVLLSISLALGIAPFLSDARAHEVRSMAYVASEKNNVVDKPASLHEPSCKLQSGITQPLEIKPLRSRLITQEQQLRVKELYQMVHAITTVTEFKSGQEELNRGTGFIVGNRFFTVNHNLTTSFPSLQVKSTSFIDGTSVAKPFFTDEEQDVAVFDLSGNLCLKHCNTSHIGPSPALHPERKVYWLRKFQEDLILKEANVVKMVAFGEMSSSASVSSCSRNSVVLIDQPFTPGSSGSPVMDSETGKIVGVIQGSVDDGELKKGYFKPINCVLAMLQADRVKESLVRL